LTDEAGTDTFSERDGTCVAFPLEEKAGKALFLLGARRTKPSQFSAT